MKAHQRLFWLLVFLLPVQLGRHFWPEWSYVLGLKIDYLSPTIYLTDILVVGILGLWSLEKLKNQSLKLKITTKNLKPLLFPLSVFFFLGVNVVFAKNQGAASYKFAKIIEFSLFGLYVAKNQYPVSSIQYPVSLAVIYSSLIAITQFILQSSLGGPLWWLGERTFSDFTPGIAKTVIGGRLIMRPYATFPHPNVLAGFILVSLILIGFRIQDSGFRRFWHWLAMILGGSAVTISFSRSAWLVGLLALSFVVYPQLPKRKILIPVFLAVVLCLVSLFYLVPQLSSDEAISQRLRLIEVAIDMIREQPLVGIGLNNFIPRLPKFWQNTGFTYWLQPVHNIFFLIAAETGLLGLTIFLWFLYLTIIKVYRGQNFIILYSLFIILLLGLFDHYWLTLQQSQLLFAVVLGLSWAKKR